MAEGIELYDENGKLQFNGDIITYTLRLTGTTYVENRRVGNTCPTSFLIPTSQTYTQALIAISGGNGYVAAFAGTYAISAGNYPKIYGTNGAPVGTPFNYYIFERSSTIPATNFGLEVRNANNEITFSSNQRVMSVINYINGSRPYIGEDYVTASGRQLAWCQGQWSGHRVSGPKSYYGGGGHGGPIIIRDVDNPEPGSYSGWQNDGKLYGGFSADGGQTVGTRQVSFDDVPIGPQPDEPQPPDFFKDLNLFIVDVTGIPIGAQFY